MTRRRDPELDALTAGWTDEERAIVERLRGLPDEGAAPDWDALERDIGRAVDDAATRPRRWAWLGRWWRPALGLGLVTAAAVLVVVVRPDPGAPRRHAAPAVDAGVAVPIAEEVRPAPPPADDDGPVVIGTAGDVDPAEIDDAMLDEVLAELGEDDWTDADAEPEDGLVPDLGLDWVDELDDAEVEAVDRWLAALDEGT